MTDNEDNWESDELEIKSLWDIIGIDEKDLETIVLDYLFEEGKDFLSISKKFGFKYTEYELRDIIFNTFIGYKIIKKDRDSDDHILKKIIDIFNSIKSKKDFHDCLSIVSNYNYKILRELKENPEPVFKNKRYKCDICDKRVYEKDLYIIHKEKVYHEKCKFLEDNDLLEINMQRKLKNETCCICLNEIYKIENSFLTKCGHEFHVACYLDYLDVTQNRSCCLCRAEI